MGIVQSTIDNLEETRELLKINVDRIVPLHNKAKSAVREYLLFGKYELARIEADDWIRKEAYLYAMELLDKYCEKLSQELPDMHKRDEAHISGQQVELAGTVAWAGAAYFVSLLNVCITISIFTYFLFLPSMNILL